MPCAVSRAVLARPMAVPASATPATAMTAAARRRPGPPARAGRPVRPSDRDGDPGQEHDPGDRQVRQPAVEDPGVGLALPSKLPLELVGRISAHPLVWLNPVCDDISHGQEPAERGHRRGEPARPVGPDGEPGGAERGHRRGADGDPPPRRRAADALTGVHREHDADEDQVGRHRPDRGRGPGGELRRPARPGASRSPGQPGRRRPSRDPIQAATPATNGPKSMIVCPWPRFQNVRMPYSGAVPVLGR